MPLTVCVVALASYNDGYESFAVKETSGNGGGGGDDEAAAPSGEVLSSSSSSSAELTAAAATETAATTTTEPSVNMYGASSPQLGHPTTNMLIAHAKSLFNGGRYMIDPDLRAKKVIHFQN